MSQQLLDLLSAYQRIKGVASLYGECESCVLCIFSFRLAARVHGRSATDRWKGEFYFLAPDRRRKDARRGVANAQRNDASSPKLSPYFALCCACPGEGRFGFFNRNFEITDYAKYQLINVKRIGHFSIFLRRTFGRHCG